jgi:hypothetical protein
VGWRHIDTVRLSPRPSSAREPWACDLQVERLRQPETVLNDPGVRAAIGLDRPVAILLLAVLHLIADEEDPAGIVAAYRDRIAPGSYVAISHGTDDINPRRPARLPSGSRPPGPRRPTSIVATLRSSGSSTVWSWWSRTWFRSRCGDRRVSSPTLRVVTASRRTTSCVWTWTSWCARAPGGCWPHPVSPEVLPAVHVSPLRGHLLMTAYRSGALLEAELVLLSSPGLIQCLGLIAWAAP